MERFSGAIAGEVVLPGSPRYEELRKPAIPRFEDSRPQALVLRSTASDVSEAIRFARETGTPVAIRSGGHCFAGRSSGDGLVLDVSPMRSVSVSGDGESGGVYPNFPDPDLADWEQAYHGPNHAWLAQVKATYDPDGVFRFPQSL